MPDDVRPEYQRQNAVDPTLQPLSELQPQMIAQQLMMPGQALQHAPPPLPPTPLTSAATASGFSGTAAVSSISGFGAQPSTSAACGVTGRVTQPSGSGLGGPATAASASGFVPQPSTSSENGFRPLNLRPDLAALMEGEIDENLSADAPAPTRSNKRKAEAMEQPAAAEGSAPKGKRQRYVKISLVQFYIMIYCCLYVGITHSFKTTSITCFRNQKINNKNQVSYKTIYLYSTYNVFYHRVQIVYILIKIQ